MKDEYGVSTIENLAPKDIHKNLSLPKYLSTNNRFRQLPEIDPEVLARAIDTFNQIATDADIDAIFENSDNNK